MLLLFLKMQYSLVQRIFIVEIDMRRLWYETFHISQEIYFEIKLF